MVIGSSPTLNGNAHDRGTLTYEPHFGLREKPFSLLPAAHFFFPAEPHKAAFDTLLTGIRRREGILALTGEVGTGKTTLCRAVLEALDRKTFAAFIRDPIVSREDLLKALLVDFGVVSVDEIRAGHLRGASRTELTYPLYDFLTALQPLDAFAVVMIDEAQNIPQALLEELRILSDLDNGQKLLQLMLIGQPELDARLAAPEMRQLTQRISVRCELTPLSAADVKRYIRHRLTVAGNGDVGFSDAAINLITATSAGVPRVINLLGDRSMSRAGEKGAALVNVDHVIGAASDLKWPRAPLESIVRENIDVPAPVPRSDEAGRHSRSMTALNMSELEPRTPPFGSGVAIGPLVTTSSQRTALPAIQGRLEQRRSGELGLRISRELDSPEQPVQQPPRRRVVFVAAAAALVILSVGGLRGWLNSVEHVRTNRADSQVAAAASLPAAVPSSGLSTRAVDAAASTREPPISESQQGRFAVQVATFSSQVRAAQSVQEFRAAGFPAYSIESTLRDGVRARTVFVGPYPDLSAAERERERVTQVPGYGPGWIVTVGSASQAQTAVVP